MKKNYLIPLFLTACMAAGMVFSCKKDSSAPPTNIGTRTSFTEEFINVNTLSSVGWMMKDNSPLNSGGPYAAWTQGYMFYDKGGIWSGFTAYSYTTLKDEFVYSTVSLSSGNTISSWLITPVLSVKNGDKISFYTRGDTVGVNTNRMQVRANYSASDAVGSNPISVGGFTTVLMDINASQDQGGYPVNWTRYEYTFNGISGNRDTRIAFRHYITNANNAKGIGIDQFRFEVN